MERARLDDEKNAEKWCAEYWRRRAGRGLGGSQPARSHDVRLTRPQSCAHADERQCLCASRRPPEPLR